MAPHISLTRNLPGRPTLNPKHLGFPSEHPINFRVPLMSLHLSSHHPSSRTHSSSTTSPLLLVIITPGPGRIHQFGLPHSPTTPGLLVQLEFLQALRLCGVSSTQRSLLLRLGWCRLRRRRLRQAEHQAQREREVVEAGAVIYPRSWTSNQVGKENMKS